MMNLNYQTILNGWCVYTLTMQGCEKPDFIWYSKVSHLTTLADAVKNPDFNRTANYYLAITSYQPDKVTAYNVVSAWMKLHGMPALNLTQWVNRRNPVQCVQTGVVYNSASDAAKALGINQSQLSQHLRRNPGYKTIRGMTFINVSSAAHVRGGKPAVIYP